MIGIVHRFWHFHSYKSFIPRSSNKTQTTLQFDELSNYRARLFDSGQLGEVKAQVGSSSLSCCCWYERWIWCLHDILKSRDIFWLSAVTLWQCDEVSTLRRSRTFGVFGVLISSFARKCLKNQETATAKNIYFDKEEFCTLISKFQVERW